MYLRHKDWNIALQCACIDGWIGLPCIESWTVDSEEDYQQEIMNKYG